MSEILNEQMSRKEFVKKAGAFGAALALFGAGAIKPEPVSAASMTFSDNLRASVYKGLTPPADTNALWIDTSVGGVMKYHNGTEWTPTLAVWG